MAVYVSDQVPETLIGDSGRIRQIITNLMGNSIKVSIERCNKKLKMVSKYCVFICSKILFSFFC